MWEKLELEKFVKRRMNHVFLTYGSLLTGPLCPKSSSVCTRSIQRKQEHQEHISEAVDFKKYFKSNITGFQPTGAAAFCCVVCINDCKIYAKRIRWCQVFLARSWESCQTLLFLINGKRAASWLHSTWRVLLTPCQVEFNYLISVFFYAIRTAIFVLLTHFGQPLHILMAVTASYFLLSFQMRKVITPISVHSIIFKGKHNGLFSFQ